MDLFFFILLSMIFIHTVADFNLQGILASLKQRDWWKENHPSLLYSDDYKIALIIHSFQWAFLTMLPLFALSITFQDYIMDIES